jgi:formate hydrogenlyase transcriptional activator
MADLGIVSHEDRYRLLLEISRIVNAPLELSEVADAVGKALQPLTAVDAMVLLTVEGERIVSRSIHASGVTRLEGDTFSDIAARALHLTPDEVTRKLPLVKPLAGSSVEYAARLGRPYVVNSLADANLHFDMDQKLRDFGIKACVLCPVTVRDRLIGAVAFSRMTDDPFTDDEVDLLNNISNIVGPALANSLAYEQIRTLKDQLQAENILLRQEIAESGEPDEMVGVSPAIQRLQDAIERVAKTDSTVLICGETGTGKELVARALHRRSSRSRNTLVKLNCAALPESLIASELFGHERGAFTGAAQRRIGRFEMASGSSLFLDEVGEVPLDVQVALLRVLQEREFERLGGTQTIRADVRLIAATNRDLPKAIAEGSFRSDLYYRLNVFPIEVPPLRNRAEDIPLLVDSFVKRFSARMGRHIRGVDRATMDLFLRYEWPGNIRELQNIVERAVILADDGVIRVEPRALTPPAPILAQTAPPPARVAAANGFLTAFRDQEREIIEGALRESRGRISGPNGAAARLQLPASTLESKIRAFGIDKHRFKPRTGVPVSSAD